MSSVHDYLKLYGRDCRLVYRPMNQNYWTPGIRYMSEEYDPSVEYNHRTIFDNEVVWDFDHPDRTVNEVCAIATAHHLEYYDAPATLWWSGNKGYHVHAFFDFTNVLSPSLMKRELMKFFIPDGAKIDMQLTGAHMIRAEHGLNEKSGNKKTLIKQHPRFPNLGKIPTEVWESYNAAVRARLHRVHNKGDLSNHPDVRYFIDTHQFGPKDDGHERALWMLCQVLKNQWKDNLDGFVDAMVEWYMASGGKKLSPQQVRTKVRYHWDRDYTVHAENFSDLRQDILSGR